MRNDRTADQQHRVTVGYRPCYRRWKVFFLFFLPCLIATFPGVGFAHTYAPRPLTVYVFLNTECPISQQYARTLSVLSRQYASSVQFVALFPSKTDIPRLIRAFSADYNLTFSGKPDRGAKLARKLSARVTPEAVVLDAMGQIRYRGAIDNWYVTLGKHRSDATELYLQRALDALIAGKVVDVEKTDAVGCLIE